MADQLQTARRHTDNSRECSCSFTTQLSTSHQLNLREDSGCFRFGRDEISEIGLWNRMHTSRSSSHFRLLRDANVLRLGEETQRFFAAFAANTALFHAAVRNAQIADEPAIYPN